MRVGVVGINHKLADLKLREAIARACQKRFGAGNSVHGEHAFLLLSTCNRTEIYFSSEDLVETHTYILEILRREVEEEFEHKLYSFFSYDCFCHIASVATGLDSAIVAETEIQGQVRSAYEEATRYSKLPAELHYLFQKALKISKGVRSKLIMTRGIPEVEHALLQTGTHLFKSFQETNVLFVGASEINRRILHFFKTKKIEKITICNRSAKNAETWAAQYSLPILAWNNLERWSEFDWIIFGTKAPDYLIQREQLSAHFTGQKLVIDLSFPRNVDPKIAKDRRIILLNIDQINRMLKCRRRWLNQALNQAAERIAASSKIHVDLYSAKERHKQLLNVVSA